MQPNFSGINVPKTPELLSDFEQFKKLLKKHTGLDLEHYKFDQTYRRIYTMMERAGFKRFTDYLQFLCQDESRMRAFVDRLAINVSEMFRNPEQYEILRTQILPTLLKQSPQLKVWSAGCSYGAEAYSLAILLHELAPGRSHQIIGTDIDQEVLERAKQGVFDESDLRSVPAEFKARYLFPIQENGRTRYQAEPQLKRYLRFERHNLLADPYPQGFDLIACRNVVIYFSDEAKDRIFREFFRALKPGGYLFVGNTERIFNSIQIGFANPSTFFYLKPLQEGSSWRNAS